MSGYTPKEFWTQLARDFGECDSTGFGPVMHPGTPEWFNKTIDRLQNRTWNRALSRCALRRGDRVLDVGCGTGRWLRRFSEKGLTAVGVDQSGEMLGLARKRGTRAPVVSAEAQKLPFRDGSFDCVSAVTVIQHILPQNQGEALSEMLRVLKPNGYLLLIELTRGQGLHVFSRSPEDWIAQVSALGAELVFLRGHEFCVLDRSFVSVVQGLRGFTGYGASKNSFAHLRTPGEDHELPGAARRVYWMLRRITMALSVWSEPFFVEVCPNRLATHGTFVFRKNPGRV